MSQDKPPLSHVGDGIVEYEGIEDATDIPDIDSMDSIISKLESYAYYLNAIMTANLNTNSRVTDLDILLSFSEEPRLKTTPEVCDSVDELSNRTALKRLNNLHERGYLMKKKTGNTYVWAIKMPTWKSPLSPWVLRKVEGEMDMSYKDD